MKVSKQLINEQNRVLTHSRVSTINFSVCSSDLNKLITEKVAPRPNCVVSDSREGKYHLMYFLSSPADLNSPKLVIFDDVVKNVQKYMDAEFIFNGIVFSSDRAKIINLNNEKFTLEILREGFSPHSINYLRTIFSGN